MFNLKTQQAKAKLFRDLHYNGKLLVLPNIWEPLGAALIENLGFPAIATASASIAFTNGYDDGENISFNDLIKLLEKITAAVDIPVTADIESGYAENNAALKENISRLIDIGIAGINFEDSRHDNNSMTSIEDQCEKISVIKNTAIKKGTDLFINARTDVFIKLINLSEEEKLSEAIRRGKAYKDAGADGFYPIILKNKEQIGQLVKEVSLPVNILLFPGIPDFESLEKIGVARLSLGPGFLKTAVNAMKNIAEKLLHYEGMAEVNENPVTSDYLKNLIPRS